MAGVSALIDAHVPRGLLRLGRGEGCQRGCSGGGAATVAAGVSAGSQLGSLAPGVGPQRLGRPRRTVVLGSHTSRIDTRAFDLHGRLDAAGGSGPEVPAAGAGPTPAPPESSGSYRASGGGLQGCPLRGVRPRRLAVRVSCSNGLRRTRRRGSTGRRRDPPRGWSTGLSPPSTASRAGQGVGLPAAGADAARPAIDVRFTGVPRVPVQSRREAPAASPPLAPPPRPRRRGRCLTASRGRLGGHGRPGRARGGPASAAG